MWLQGDGPRLYTHICTWIQTCSYCRDLANDDECERIIYFFFHIFFSPFYIHTDMNVHRCILSESFEIKPEKRLVRSADNRIYAASVFLSLLLLFHLKLLPHILLRDSFIPHSLCSITDLFFFFQISSFFSSFAIVHFSSNYRNEISNRKFHFSTYRRYAPMHLRRQECNSCADDHKAPSILTVTAILRIKFTTTIIRRSCNIKSREIFTT